MSTSRIPTQPHRRPPAYSDNNYDDDDFQLPFSLPLKKPTQPSFSPFPISPNPIFLPLNKIIHPRSPSPSFSKPQERETSDSTFGGCRLDSTESTFETEFGNRVLNEKGKACCSPNSIQSRLLKSVASGFEERKISESTLDGCGLDSIESTIQIEFGNRVLNEKGKSCYSSNSIESRLIKSVASFSDFEEREVSESNLDGCGLDSMQSNIEIEFGNRVLNEKGKSCCSSNSIEANIEIEFGNRVLNEKGKSCYSSNSIESKLLQSVVSFTDFDRNSDCLADEELGSDGIESCSDLDVLLKLCDKGGNQLDNNSRICCPLCGVDLSHLPNELREEHTNDCLDKEDTPIVVPQNDNAPVVGPGQVVDVSPSKSPRQAVDASPVIEWLRGLNLSKYEDIFVQEEIDWDTLQWLTEDDLLAIGITALGPRKKIVHALGELRKGSSKNAEIKSNTSADVTEDNNRTANKLITDFFPGSTNHKRKESLSKGAHKVDKSHLHSERKKAVVRKTKDRKLRDIPQWCCIPGTQFRVDAFKYLRSDCSHWFLTHFHIDHYQGLTRSFSHGKIFCSLITAKLVNMKIGIPWDKLQVMPLNQKINVAGIDVTCFDANHCPGAIILLFEPPSGKAVLHTGDFRFSEEMTNIPVLKTCQVQTLVLDTTYCNPQFDFPKQEAVIQFVIEAIQAEAFNQKTLFLIGSYTIGKERLFVEVARVLHKKVYVAPAKLRILECLGIPVEDLKWFTSNEQESHIHVVPMWTLASIKRLKCLSNQYARNYSLIVAFSPTGWTFGKGKKKSTGRRWQQGTIVRYEVPYSEHSSFTELKEFVQFISPENIVPSVNNDGVESANAMVSLLLS